MKAVTVTWKAGFQLSLRVAIQAGCPYLNQAVIKWLASVPLNEAVIKKRKEKKKNIIILFLGCLE